MRFGIAARLGLLLASVGVLASGLTGFYAFEASRGLLVESAKNKLLATTQVITRRINSTREEISRDLQLVATHPATIAALQKADKSQQDQTATLFHQMMSVQPGYFQMRVISANENGMEKVRVDRYAGGLIRVTGNDLREKGHNAYVYDTLKIPAGATYLSHIVINREGGSNAGLDRATVQLATPVVSAQGRVLGVVVINIDLEGTFALLGTDLPGQYQLFLANRNGDFLIHPDKPRTFGFERGRRILLQDEFAATRELIEGKVDQVLIEARDGRYASAPVVAAFVSSMTKASYTERRLIVGVAQPLAGVLDNADQLGATVLKIVMAFCAISVLLAALVARAMTRPINAMSAAMQDFAADHRVRLLPVLREDEIAVLAHSFNQMQNQITRQLVELQDQRQELEHLAQHDMLTGLPNRRLFHERLEQALARAQRSEEPFAVLFIDLDHFKDVNDRLGHDVGDAVLTIVGERLTGSTRKVDTVARLGGDEFAVLLGSPAPAEHVVSIADKLLEGLREPMIAEGHPVQVGCSIGISQFPQDGDTVAALIARADRAMYHAKVDGRNSYRFHIDSTSGFGTE